VAETAFHAPCSDTILCAVGKLSPLLASATAVQYLLACLFVWLYVCLGNLLRSAVRMAAKSATGIFVQLHVLFHQP
jgi:hypothetical protein